MPASDNRSFYIHLHAIDCIDTLTQMHSNCEQVAYDMRPMFILQTLETYINQHRSAYISLTLHFINMVICVRMCVSATVYC